jgi:uncharacterized protein with PQ loop repeat
MNSNNIKADVLGWCLITGAILSYIPQYYKLYKKKDCSGISLINVFLGCLSCYFNTVGFILINKSKFECDEYDYYCIHKDLPLFQMINVWICMNILFIMVHYYSYQHKQIMNNNVTYEYSIKLYRTYVFVMIVYSILTLLLYVYVHNTTFMKYYANITNIISSITSIFMWIPQIKETYRLKKANSLSLISIGIHAIGCVATIVYQMYYIHQQVWVILPYLIGGFLELVIIAICLYYINYKPYDNVLHLLKI